MEGPVNEGDEGEDDLGMEIDQNGQPDDVPIIVAEVRNGIYQNIQNGWH